MKYIDLNFVEPSKKKDCIGDFANCVHEEDGEPYICLACEYKQVKEKYPNAKYTNDCEWILYEEDGDIRSYFTKAQMSKEDKGN